MYSYGPPHMAKQKQDNHLEHTYSSYVRIRDVALKTCQRRWMIGRSGERGSGISVLAARHDDDDHDDMCKLVYLVFLSVYSVLVYHHHLNSLVGRVFVKGLGDLGSIPGWVIPKTSKMVLDTSLFNTQQYKVRIKGKVEQSRGRSSVLPNTLV